MPPEIGSTAPDFELRDSTGTLRSLGGLVEGGRRILIFYRGHWWPYCLRQLAEYEQRSAEIRAAGAELVALSVDDAARSEAVRRQLGLSFPILCDTRREVVRAWDLYNPKEQGGIAVPAVFVIGPRRQVLHRSIDATAKRVSTEGVVGFLRGGATGAALERVPVHAGVRNFARAIGNALRRGLRTPER